MRLQYNLDFIQDKKKKPEIKRALLGIEKSLNSGKKFGSFFLDPYEQKLISSIAKKNDVPIVFFGGNKSAERKVFISGSDGSLNFDDLIQVLSFKSDGKIAHPDVLGSLLSLGLSREEIGDIVVDDDIIEFAILKEDAPFVKYNLKKIKNERVSVDFKAENKLMMKKEKFFQMDKFVSSLRLDVLVASLINVSRKQATKLIRGNDVRVNFQVISSPAKEVEEGAVISIRHHGRYIFDEIEGLSKKGNYRVRLRKFE